MTLQIRKISRPLCCGLIVLSLQSLAVKGVQAQEGSVPVATNPAPMGRSSNLTNAIATEAFLRNYKFNTYQLRHDGKTLAASSEATVKAFRKSDRLRLTQEVLVFNSEEEAKTALKGMMSTNAGHMPTGTPTGRKIAQEVWSSSPNDLKGALANFVLFARDGQTILQIRMILDITGERDEKGNPVLQFFTPTDLRMAERMVTETLAGLVRQGLTSKPARTVKP